MTAADGVVLPIPMSPVTRHRAPPRTRSAATAAPTSSAARASAVVIAGSTARFAVPLRIFAIRRPGWPIRSPSTPTSTTVTDAPAWRASALMAAPPARKLATI
jgi:hypothetical protein